MDSMFYQKSFPIDEINETVCRIRKNIVEKIYNNYYYQNCNCRQYSQRQCDSGGNLKVGECVKGRIDGLIEGYAAKASNDGKSMLVETPALD